MENKAKILIIVAVVMLIISIFSISRKNMKGEITDISEKSNSMVVKTTFKYEEDTGEYVVYNSETGEEIARSADEAEVEIYKTVPDYNPDPAGQFNNKDVVMYEE